MNVKKFFEKNKMAVLTATTGMLVAVPSFAFAEGETASIASTMTTSFQTVVTDTLSCIAAVAPIGITIFGAMFVWKKGKQFFSSLTAGK